MEIYSCLENLSSINNQQHNYDNKSDAAMPSSVDEAGIQEVQKIDSITTTANIPDHRKQNSTEFDKELFIEEL